MNKVVLNEFKRKHIIFDIIFYSVFVLLGFALLNFADMGLKNVIKHAPCIFYTFAFFSILVYFANRRKDDYEFLFFGFINVMVGSFIIVYPHYPNTGFILSDAILLYSIANVLNKSYSCKRLIEEKNINFFVKMAISILLLFLGVFVVSSLYEKVDLGILILGYYFATFGLLSLLEPLSSILFEDAEIKGYIFNFLSYNKEVKKAEKVEEKVEAKEEVKEEKPVAKKPVKKTTTKKATAKKTTKKATTKKKTTKKTSTRKTTKK